LGDVNCLRCKYRHTDNGNCTAVGGFCTAVPAAHCPLLREYLDTELTPQEVLSMKFEWCAMMDALNSIGGGYTRLRELAEADRNHQIVIRPCKIGDTVWAADMEPVIPLHVMADAVYLEGRHGGDYERLSNFGSVVFLSQEEAKEAASHWMK
jgi:hypothetical protein